MADTPVTPELPRVLMDVTEERQRQIAKGWTPEHDEDHDLNDWAGLVAERFNGAYSAVADEDPEDARTSLIQAMALIAAMVESMDRHTEGDEDQ